MSKGPHGPYSSVSELRDLRRELIKLAEKYPDYLGDRDHVGLVEKSFSRFMHDVNTYLLAAEDAVDGKSEGRE